MSSSFLATTLVSYSSITHNALQRRTTTHPSRLPQVAAAAANNHSRVATISCEQQQQQPKQQQTVRRKEGSAAGHVIDRRNMLVRLGGGLYGATSVANKAIAEPYTPPDISTCKGAKDEYTHDNNVPCCSPYKATATIKDFKKPGRNEPKRVRKPAHKYTPDDVAKFERAVQLMKDLPANDSRNFWQQGTIHCTFCNGAFDQAGTNVPLQIHGSWFFLPWHRMYLYFWERILGSLIGDPTFAIPYWNWDAADGMYMPEMYWKNKDSPLFDNTRNKDHYRMVMDFNYSYEKPYVSAPIDDIVMRNQCALNRDFTEAEYETSLFMGKPLRAGETLVDVSGSCESIHNMMHMWAGPPEKPFHNMGNFATAGKDPLFYAHHGNVDRMWDTYTKSREGRPEFRDRDWLDSTFIFIDENEDIVRCRVRDFLRVERLGYSYSEEEQPWREMDYKSCKELLSDAGRNKQGNSDCETVQVSVFGSQPRQLKETIRVLVKRPAWSTKNPPEGVRREELLAIKGIEYTSKMPPKFDVYVTPAIKGTSEAFDSVCKDIKGDELRCFRKVLHPKHHHHGGHGTKSEHIVAITRAVEGVDSDRVVITLVPSDGEVTIGGIETIGVEILES